MAIDILDLLAGRGSVLVTGRAKGRDGGGGRASIRSPFFRLPDSGRATLRLRYWVGLGARARAGDGFTVHLVDADGRRIVTLLRIRGDGHRHEPRWQSLVRALPAGLRGRSVAVQIEAVDTAADAVVEAGVDQVRVTRS